MRIAEISPPWVRVPPEGYGGIEWIVSLLTDELVDRGHDVTHDHTGAMATCLGALSNTPVLHTLHGPFNPDVQRLCRMVADRIYFNSISDSQRSGCPELNYVGTIYNAVEVETYPFRAEKEDYALF